MQSAAIDGMVEEREPLLQGTCGDDAAGICRDLDHAQGCGALRAGACLNADISFRRVAEFS